MPATRYAGHPACDDDEERRKCRGHKEFSFYRGKDHVSCDEIVCRRIERSERNVETFCESKAVERFVGYLKKFKEDIKLTYRKPRELRVGLNVDTNYATNKDDRKSVTAAFYTLGGTLTNWVSKTQRQVTLSSTEAEYCGLATATQELVFMQMLLSEIGECVLPGIILEDNTGAIFLVKNQSVGARTKHIDIRHHWLRAIYDRKEMTVLFCRSEHNEADVNTKNLPEATHKLHATNIRNGTIRLWRHWWDIVKQIKEK